VCELGAEVETEETSPEQVGAEPQNNSFCILAGSYAHVNTKA